MKLIVGSSYFPSKNFFGDLNATIKKLVEYYPDKQHVKICFVPTASRDSFLQRIFFRLHLKVLPYLYKDFPSFEVTTLNTDKILDRDNFNQVKQDLFSQDIIYIGGGATEYLVKTWKSSGFDELLKEVLDKSEKKIISGVSAGLACWFDKVLTDDGKSAGPYRLIDGLGWIKGHCTPHYHNNRVEEFDSLLSAGIDDKEGYACEDGTSLIFHFNNHQFTYNNAHRTRHDANAYRLTFSVSDDERHFSKVKLIGP